MSDLQVRIDALDYPPTHTYVLDGIGGPTPTGILAERWALLRHVGGSFWDCTRDSSTFLDVGANKGFFSLMARAAGFEVTAIDPDPACAQLVGDLDLDSVQATFREWAPPAQRLDRVFLGNAHHYCYRDAGWAWALKLAAVVKPRGQVLIEGPLGNDCPDMAKTFDGLPGLLADFTRGAFFAALHPFFDVLACEPTVSYTPGRFVVRLVRLATPVCSPDQVDRTNLVWTNEKATSTLYAQPDGSLAKLYREPFPGLERSVAFGAVLPGASPLVAEVRRSDCFTGWLEAHVSQDTQFRAGQAFRPPSDSAALTKERLIWRAACRRNAILARLGMVDVDLGLANWSFVNRSFGLHGGAWFTVDKNSIWPIVDVGPDEWWMGSVNHGRIWRTTDWAYTPGVIKWEEQVLIKDALASRSSVRVEAAFTAVG